MKEESIFYFYKPECVAVLRAEQFPTVFLPQTSFDVWFFGEEFKVAAIFWVGACENELRFVKHFSPNLIHTSIFQYNTLFLKRFFSTSIFIFILEMAITRFPRGYLTLLLTP